MVTNIEHDMADLVAANEIIRCARFAVIDIQPVYIYMLHCGRSIEAQIDAQLRYVAR